MTNAEIVIAAATLLGPIAAVQIQKWLESWRGARERRLSVFRTLMATRATNLSPEHVQALNAIPIEFYGKKKILDKWEEYYDHLGNKALAPDLWENKRLDLFVQLMGLIAVLLGYKFNVSDVKKIYHPAGHTNIENEQHEIRANMLGVLKGEQSLSLAIKEFPVSEDAVKLQSSVQEALLKSYTPSGALKVEINSAEAASR